MTGRRKVPEEPGVVVRCLYCREEIALDEGLTDHQCKPKLKEGRLANGEQDCEFDPTPDPDLQV